MDYKEVDAIWNKIVEKFKELEKVDAVTEHERQLYEVYREACERGRIKWEVMYKLDDGLTQALKLRNL